VGFAGRRTKRQLLGQYPTASSILSVRVIAGASELFYHVTVHLAILAVRAREVNTAICSNASRPCHFDSDNYLFSRKKKFDHHHTPVDDREFSSFQLGNGMIGPMGFRLIRSGSFVLYREYRSALTAEKAKPPIFKSNILPLHVVLVFKHQWSSSSTHGQKYHSGLPRNCACWQPQHQSVQ